MTKYNYETMKIIKAFEKELLSEEEYIGFIKGNIILKVAQLKRNYTEEEINNIFDYLFLLKTKKYNKINHDRINGLEDVDLKKLKEDIRKLNSESRRLNEI